MLSEKSQTQKTLHDIIPFKKNFWKLQNYRKETQIGDCLRVGAGIEHKDTFWGSKDTIKLDCDGCWLSINHYLFTVSKFHGM